MLLRDPFSGRGDHEHTLTRTRTHGHPHKDTRTTGETTIVSSKRPIERRGDSGQGVTRRLPFRSTRFRLLDRPFLHPELAFLCTRAYTCDPSERIHFVSALFDCVFTNISLVFDPTCCQRYSKFAGSDREGGHSTLAILGASRISYNPRFTPSFGPKVRDSESIDPKTHP